MASRLQHRPRLKSLAAVAAAALVALATSAYWLLPLLAAGFWLRVLFGPRLSPLALFATKVAAPRLGPPKVVPGPPKRFAQGIGAMLTTVASLLALGFGAQGVADVLLGVLIVAAGLESIFALCLGCEMFALMMRIGLVPQRVCAECADLRSRWA